ncbi:MAG TPA: hypothetical protein PL047_09615 [Methanothrix sp.]|nr:hypothetical protein [Methanothrix sp.]
MRAEDVQQIAKFRLGACLDTLERKAEEYTEESDPLHNFVRAGAMLGCSPARALVGMWAKHVISILDIVDRTDRGETVRAELIEEKVTDAICYLILLEAMLRFQNSSMEVDQ